MNSSGSSRGSESPYSSDGRLSLSQEENIQAANISSSLQCIPYLKLTNLSFINRGAYGTVHRAFHADWRVPVAVKFFPTDRHLVESERNKILKEAEILHKARFSYILPILGICNENDSLGIVTEYMTSGSLNQLLHEDNPLLEIAWPLRFRILYEIALGVNFLHNMTPSLLHHDLKTQNILLDNEFHVKIADFGLSKWRMLSSSQSFGEHSPPGGTIVYMPPEDYEPSIKNKRGSVKHDMYSYAIIMWEVLTRKQPYEGATNPMQIMFSVSKGNRPDISEESLPLDVHHRDVFVSLMQSGWANDPNDRPAFLKCLLELEPVLKTYDEITILEGILKIKKMRNNISSSTTQLPFQTQDQQLPSNEDVHRSNVDSSLPDSRDYFPGLRSCDIHLITDSRRHSQGEPVQNDQDVKDSENKFFNYFSTTPAQQYPSPVLPSIDLITQYGTETILPTPSPVQESVSLAHQWIQRKRNQIVNQMTEACLNQCLDALISSMVIMKEDYELIKSKPTRCSKVRQLIDTSDIQGEVFARVIVQKLRENRQNDLQPFPEI
ncbi:receptor-interacting serine/threonine-protein kinase 2 [Pelodytes ibericus]